MTQTTLARPMTAEERQAAAIVAWHESAGSLSAAELGAMFKRSARWGRQVIALARQQAAATAPERQPVAAEPGERRQDRQPQAATAPPAVRRVTTLAVVVVAVVAAAASYDHQRLLAELAGEGWRSWLLPLSVDGLIVAASMSMLVRRRAGLPAGALAWCALLLGVGASLAANVAAAHPTVVGRLVAAWPPVALLLAHELLLGQHRQAPSGTS